MRNLLDNTSTRSTMYIQRNVFLQTLMIFSVRDAVTLVFSVVVSSANVMVLLVNCSVELC